MAKFLLEVGVEEIPDWMIEPALADLSTKFQASFGHFGGSSILVDGTPRRLVLSATDLLERAPDAENVVQGPYLSAGGGAAQGFAKKWNASVDQLVITSDQKGERYIFHQRVEGQSAMDALASKLPDVITSIAWPKTMFWTSRNAIRFIRPIRWLVSLLDSRVVPFEVAGVKSGNQTSGHRVLGLKTPIPVTVDNYFDKLRENYVIVNAAERRSLILNALPQNVQKDEALVQTLCYLTEFPNSIRGSFDDAYLSLPKEILSTVMRFHQRYFSIFREDGSLAPEFIAITNTDGDPDGLIRKGNEKVLRARFNDASFFWRVDQQVSLSSRVPNLSNVTYHAKLGTYKDKTDRMQKLAATIAVQIGADEKVVATASLLSKCDLTTDMVKEFTELQGIVGGLYAEAQGEGTAVSIAIYDQYKPVSMDDAIPRTPEAQAVALADRLDTLRECFRIGLIPTGSGDPFALRRAGQGIVKILLEADLKVELFTLLEDVPGLAGFMKDRVEFYMKEVLHLTYDEVAAALGAGVGTLPDLVERAQAINRVRATPDFEPLAASFKRLKNILRQAAVSGVASVDEAKLTVGPETDLYKAFMVVTRQLEHSASYEDRLRLMATLRPQVDSFFDKILVNDPDPVVRENRLALLQGLLNAFSAIADFSEIVTQGVSA